MKENLKQWCDKWDAVREQLWKCVDDLKKWPYDSVRRDRLEVEEPKYAELLRAVAADYPDAVQIWLEFLGWRPTVTRGRLRPQDVHRIEPDWEVPDEPREYVYLSGAAAGKATPAPREWFWGEALWQTRIFADLTALGYRIPTRGTDSREISAANIPYMKVEGWRWVGYIYGEREPGEPHNPYMEPVRRMNGRLEYADWSVWRRTS